MASVPWECLCKHQLAYVHTPRHQRGCTSSVARLPVTAALLEATLKPSVMLSLQSLQYTAYKQPRRVPGRACLSTARSGRLQVVSGWEDWPATSACTRYTSTVPPRAHASSPASGDSATASAAGSVREHMLALTGTSCLPSTSARDVRDVFAGICGSQCDVIRRPSHRDNYCQARRTGGSSASVSTDPRVLCGNRQRGTVRRCKCILALLALHNSILRVLAASVRKKYCLKGRGCVLALLALHSSSYQVTCSGNIYTCTACTKVLEVDAAWHTLPCSQQNADKP